MSLKGRFMRKLRARVWANGRRIVGLRKRALDAEKYTRFELHSQIDTLKTERERDIQTLEDLCTEGNGVLDEVKAVVEDAVDEIRHALDENSHLVVPSGKSDEETR